MSQAVDLEVFYPHPPERVWRVLTDRRALANWMMENDFEPKLGHRFQFYSNPLPGLKTTIQCEVVELEEPSRLVYTWKDAATTEPSLVVWTLTTVAGGTQLRLKHHQYSYTTAVATSNSPGTTSASYNSAGTVTLGLGATHLYSNWLSYAERCSSTPQSSVSQVEIPSYRSATLELPVFQTFNWDYFLNHKLPQILATSD